MKIFYLDDREPSEKAKELVDFDVDSIRQIISARHSGQPSIWVANTEQYEKNGRLLRDSPSPRLLAYTPEDRVLYATDGCNSCTHRISTDLNPRDEQQVRDFADATKIEAALVRRMAELAFTLPL